MKGDHKPLAGQTLQGSYNLLCQAINEDDEPDCDASCDSFCHTEACNDRTSSAAILIRQQEQLQLLDELLDCLYTRGGKNGEELHWKYREEVPANDFLCQKTIDGLIKRMNEFPKG